MMGHDWIDWANKWGDTKQMIGNNDEL
jgi:hypothetical protein